MKALYRNIVLMAAAMIAFSSCDDDDSIISGTDAAILSCSVSSEGISLDAGIASNEIVINVPQNLDLTKLDVDFEISEGAVLSPQPELIKDWSNPVSFKVLSANEQNERDYTFKVTVDTDKIFDTTVGIGNKTALEKFAENGYTVLGGLKIFDDETGNPIENLSALNSVKDIKTDFEIRSESFISARMESLRSIGNFDVISYSIEEVAFPSLEYVAGRFRIGNNEAAPLGNYTLVSLELDNLKSIGKSLVLHYNEELTNIKMPKLEYVGKNLQIDGGKYTNLDMIKNIKEVRGGVIITSSELTSIKNFNIKKIGQAFILSAPKLESLEGLNIESVPYLSITGSEDCKIKSFKGLENINVTEALDIAMIPLVESTKYLPIKDGMEQISLQYLPRITSLEGFENVKEIGNLYIKAFIDATNLNELSNITSVKNLFIEKMPSLIELPNMSKLTKVEDVLMLSELYVLKSVKGLASLEEVGNLNINNLLEIESLEGFDNLKKITNGSLIIGGCPKIKDVNHFAKLSEVNMPAQKDLIYITNNELLEDYTGMKDILIKYWNEGSKKFPKVKIVGNKYNPSYEDLVAGKCKPE